MMTIEAKSAVASLIAAKDIPTLESAIEQASFLDKIPGDDRQKLRGNFRFSTCLCEGKAHLTTYPQERCRSHSHAPFRSQLPAQSFVK